MSRGGPRPGAGAPKGNLNALKHGAYSQQLQDLLQDLHSIPGLRRIVHALNTSKRAQALRLIQRARQAGYRDNIRAYLQARLAEGEGPSPSSLRGLTKEGRGNLGEVDLGLTTRCPISPSASRSLL